MEDCSNAAQTHGDSCINKIALAVNRSIKTQYNYRKVVVKGFDSRCLGQWLESYPRCETSLHEGEESLSLCESRCRNHDMGMKDELTVLGKRDLSMFEMYWKDF